MNTPLLIYLIAADVLALLLMLSDKRRAKRRERRIPEASLFLAALRGGALGGTIGMFLFRHKTKHIAFRVGFPLLALIQAALCIWYMGGIGK